MQNAPAFLAYAEAKNNDVLKALYEKRTNWACNEVLTSSG